MRDQGCICEWSMVKIRRPDAYRHTFHNSPFTIHNPQFTFHHSTFTIHLSPFNFHNSPFTIHLSQFNFHNSQFTFHNSQFTIHNSPPDRYRVTIHLSHIYNHIHRFFFHFLQRCFVADNSPANHQNTKTCNGATGHYARHGQGSLIA